MNNFSYRLIFTISLLLLSSLSFGQVDKFINKYDEIRLISYNSHRKYALRDNPTIEIKNNKVIIKGVKIVDNVILDNKYSKKIFNVLLSQKKECSVADCYNPRHILLFFKTKKLVGYFEFCSSCGGSRKSKNISINSSFCSEHGNDLIKIFKEMKLKNNGEETEDYKYY
ncbi:hypothetical protein [Flavobacterium sp.]|jgi:hypothetical protein|uniref:hypothetical protein n=1 Tax=Flavobacterium sp. TaxID=239 RepID=UPI0037BFC102